MAISISSHAGTTQALAKLHENAKETQSALAKLSSGKRVNSAQDDAAALAIAVSLTAQQTSLDQDARNAGDAVDLTTTADVALGGTSDILARLRELAMESGSGVLDTTQRLDIQNESDALRAELDRIAASTEVNGTPLLSGRASLTYQVGAQNVAANDEIAITTGDASSAALGVGTLSLAPPAGAATALDSIDAAMQNLSSTRATLGAQANRASSAGRLATQMSINLAGASSSLIDADVATEASHLSSSLILGNVSVAVLLQANQSHQTALKLLNPGR
jgi:flagellin